MTEEERPTSDSIKTHHHPAMQTDDKLKLRNLLNIIFMILAVAAVVIYFAIPMPKGTPYFFICCFIAVIVKGIEVSIRMTILKNKTK